jgi:hypothetical protein
MELCLEYNSRELKYDDDIINAFAGFANTLDPIFGPFHFGIPERFVSAAILWYPEEGSTRPSKRSTSVHLPSWSWMAWKGHFTWAQNMNRRTRRRGSIGRLEDSDDPENSEDSENSTEATFLNNIASYSFGGAIGVNEDQQTALQYIHIRTQRLFFRVEVDELVAVVIDRSGYPCGLIQMNARPLNFYAQDIGGMHEFIALSCGRTTDLNTPLSIPCHDWPSDMFRGKVNIL